MCHLLDVFLAVPTSDHLVRMSQFVRMPFLMQLSLTGNQTWATAMRVLLLEHQEEHVLDTWWTLLVLFCLYELTDAISAKSETKATQKL